MSEIEKRVRGRQKQGRRRFRAGVLGLALGAVTAYFGDPDNGRRRRALARDRGLAFLRRMFRRTERAGRAVSAEAYGVSQKIQHRTEEPKELDDTTLAQKVQTEIFRDPEVPKGQINVNAANGVVSLRGEVDSPELIDELVKRTRKVQGVRDVENLLHAPGTPAPTHQ
jgi:BON domain-containing protein